MKSIPIKDIIKLRTMTGVGVIDAKNALIQANNNFDEAINILRKRGKKISNKFLNRKSVEGIIMTKLNKDASLGVIISLNCETDFVAKNEEFINFGRFLVDIGLNCNSKNELLQQNINGIKIEDKIIDYINMMGEKIEIQIFKKISAPLVGSYVHIGYKLGAIVGFSHKIIHKELGKEIAMHIVAMNPIGIDEHKLDINIIEKELDLYRYLLRKEGKSEHMIESIAQKKLDKFFKDNILIHQKFINNEKLTIKEYLSSIQERLEVISFERVSVY